jgi:hypothetical protein
MLCCAMRCRYALFYASTVAHCRGAEMLHAMLTCALSDVLFCASTVVLCYGAEMQPAELCTAPSDVLF